MTYRAFELADKYRNPVYLLLDGFLGTMMEPVELPEALSEEELARIRAEKTWAARGNRGGEPHSILCGPGLSSTLDQQTLNIRDAEMYARWEESEQEYEALFTEDAELIITAYGISGRIAKSAVSILRREGYPVGLIRPLKVNPFPVEAYERLDFSRLKGVLSAEMSIPAQFAVDVKHALCARAPLYTVLSSGGSILERERIIEDARAIFNDPNKEVGRI